MEKKSKKSIVIGITSLFLITLVLLGLTYAYYRTRIIGNTSNTPSISVQSKKMEIVYQDGEASLKTNGIIGFEDEKDYTATKKFSVKNNGDTTENFMVVIDNLDTNFERLEDWSYTLKYGTTTTESIPLKINPYQVIAESVSIAPEETIEFVLTLTYKYLSDVDQRVDMGKSLSLLVNIDEIPTVMRGYKLQELEDDNGVITLTGDTVLCNELLIADASINTLDLNGYTLTLNPDLGCIGNYNNGYNGAYPIDIVTPSQFEIKNGTIRRGENLTAGSMIVARSSNAKVTLNNVVVDGNKVVTSEINSSSGDMLWEGAGVFCNQCDYIYIEKSEIINNYGTGSGIGIKAIGGSSDLAVVNSIIKNNKIVTRSGQSGAAIFAPIHSVAINGTTIENNIADSSIGTVDLSYAQAIEFDSASIIRNNVATNASGLLLRYVQSATVSGKIEDNKTTAVDGNGGGLYTLLDASDQMVTIENTAVIRNNSAAAGGGIYVNGPASGTPGNVIMNGGLIEGNTAYGTPAANTLKDGGGAGIYVSRGILEINGGTVQNNTSTSKIGNAIVVSHAGKNTEGGKLTITGGTILGSVAVAEGYGTLTLNGVTQNGETIS